MKALESPRNHEQDQSREPRKVLDFTIPSPQHRPSQELGSPRITQRPNPGLNFSRTSSIEAPNQGQNISCMETPRDTNHGPSHAGSMESARDINHGPSRAGSMESPRDTNRGPSRAGGMESPRDTNHGPSRAGGMESPRDTNHGPSRAGGMESPRVPDVNRGFDFSRNVRSESQNSQHHNSPRSTMDPPRQLEQGRWFLGNDSPYKDRHGEEHRSENHPPRSPLWKNPASSVHSSSVHPQSVPQLSSSKVQTHGQSPSTEHSPLSHLSIPSPGSLPSPSRAYPRPDDGSVKIPNVTTSLCSEQSLKSSTCTGRRRISIGKCTVQFTHAWSYSSQP